MPSNGNYSQSDLVLIEPALGWPSGYGQPRLRRNHVAMMAQLRSKGFGGSVNEIYRTMATQVYYRNLYLSGQGSPAAIPGTSKHGDGLAEDWNSPMTAWASAMQVFWLSVEGPCGYSSAQGRADGEPWHKVSVKEPNPGWEGTGTAGGGATPITNTSGDGDMPNFYSVTNGRTYYGRYWVPDPQHLQILQRYDASARTGKLDTFNAVEQTWIDQALTANGMAPDVAPIIDAAQLAAAVSQAVVAGLPSGSDAKAIAAAVDAAVADNFAALPGQVLDLESKRLTS